MVQGRPGDAWRCFEMILNKYPRDPIFLGNAGLALCRIGEYDKAEEFLRKAFKYGSRDPIVLNNYGVCLAELGQYQEAAQFYREVISKLDTENTEVLSNIGSVFSKAGFHEEALKCYLTALRKNPQDPALLNNYAMALEALDQLNEALYHYNLALDIQPR
ncbi:MAG: tetratricopeptide repeat protein, partial [Syntrophomonadaceae bacterium]|nr:tetratricopeptide repeat protein [Syntrophomonadaceae bacterium]